MKLITAELLDQLTQRARELPRRRANLNLHDGAEAPVQRMLMALEPGTYVRPHRHPQANKWELLTALRGALTVLCFDEDGQVSERLEFTADGARIGMETPPGVMHMVLSQAPGSIMLEVKEGPYDPATASEFAVWAPEEGTPEAAELEAWAQRAGVGDRWR